MRTPQMPVAPRSRMDWQSLPAGLTILLLGLCLALPPGAQATAIATSDLTVRNLSIMPASGTVTLLDAWTLDTFAQAQNSLGELDQQFSPLQGPGTATADAMVTYADGHGQVSAFSPPPDFVVTGSPSSNVTISGCNRSAASSTGQGTLFNTFMLTGGSGSVTVQFGADIAGNLHVMTDDCGVEAFTEVSFQLQVFGELSPLFYNNIFSIGPNDAMTTAVSQPLINTLTLQFDQPYSFLISVDSESHGRTDIPEPSTLILLLSGCLGLLLTAWARHRRARTLAPHVVLTRLGMPLMLTLACLLAAAPVQAKYIGGEPPSCCKCEPGRPCTDVPGGSAISLVEGNLKEQYTLPSITSATGPTIHFALAYNSYNANGSHAQVDTVLGYGWTHSYNIFLFSQLGHIFRMDGDGRVTKYKRGSGGTFTPAPGYFETLVKNSNGTFTLTQKDQTVFQFAQVSNTPFLVGGPVYRLTRITDRNNNTTTLSYTNGDLTSITDTYGRSLTLSYTSQHKLATVTDPLGRTTTFTYDATGRQLRALTDPAGKTTQYTYDVSYHITTKIDKDGRMFSYSYDTRGNPVAIVDGANNRLFSLTNTQNWATDSTALARDLLRVYVPATTSKTA